MEIGQNDFQVSVMHQAGHHWKWPQSKDNKIFYLRKQIQKLEEPTIVNKNYKFCEKI